jgi:hypothetical protein
MGGIQGREVRHQLRPLRSTSPNTKYERGKVFGKNTISVSMRSSSKTDQKLLAVFRKELGLVSRV